MSVLSDLADMVRLACLTEDRTNAEQHALLRVALRVDNEANAQVTGNRTMWSDPGREDANRLAPLSHLVDLVYSTRYLVDDQREVRLPAKTEEKYRDRLARYEKSPVAEGVVG